MTDTLKLPWPVAIVSSGKERLPFLMSTLTHLATILRNTLVYVLLDDEDYTDPYYFGHLQIAKDLFSLNNNVVEIKISPAKFSVAQKKAAKYPTILTRYLLGLDDDIILPQTSLELLIKTYDHLLYTGQPIGILRFPCVDVANHRGYQDHTLEVQPQAKFQNCELDTFKFWETYPALFTRLTGTYGISMSVMDLNLLEGQNIFKTWQDYPKHVRGHDSVAGDMLRKVNAPAYFVFGAKAYHIGLLTKHLSVEEWHSDPIYPHLDAAR